MRAVIILLGVLGAFFTYGLFLHPLPPSWMDDRRAGEPIDGYWIRSEEGGCFGDDTSWVWHYHNDMISAVRGVVEAPLGYIRSVIVGNGQVVTEVDYFIRRNGGIETVAMRVIYQDYGSYLNAVTVEREGILLNEGFISNARLGRCSDYTLWARLSLLWRRAFIPGEAQWVDPRQDAQGAAVGEDSRSAIL